MPHHSSAPPTSDERNDLTSLPQVFGTWTNATPNSLNSSTATSLATSAKYLDPRGQTDAAERNDCFPHAP